MRNISILGSTGSIGRQALEVIKPLYKNFKVRGLACNANIELLKKQIQEFKPELVAVFDKVKADELSAHCDIEVHSGIDGLVKVAKLDSSDTIINSFVGSIGVVPTIEAIETKKRILLANKETLVTAGEIVMQLANKNKVEIIPIDSEHSAVFQCIKGENSKDVKKIIITCSGGAFRNKSFEELKRVIPREALKHPNWTMGNKITIDSATLMNKGFEVIEARMLFDIDYEKIDVVIHPQSIVHSLVEFKDTSVLAQMGWPDMKLPIQYALSYPERFDNDFRSLDLCKVSQLDFSKPDTDRFPCLKYAFEAGKIGGTMPCVMNAANEIAVKAFLENKIEFLDIPKLIRQSMDRHKPIKHPRLNEILDIDNKIKCEIMKEIESQ